MTDHKKTLREYLGNPEKKTSWKEQARKEIRKEKGEDLSFSIALAILKELKAQEKSQTWLAKKIGVSRQYMSKVLKGKENLTLDTIDKLSHALGRTLIQVNQSHIATPRNLWKNKRNQVIQRSIPSSQWSSTYEHSMTIVHPSKDDETKAA